MKIEQVMNQPVITCRASDTAHGAAGLMWENDCGALPVVNADGVLIGMITDRDLCMAAYTSGRSLQSIFVGDAMAKTVLTCLPSDEIADAEKVMGRAQVRRLPVVDGHSRPIGLVSMNDIAHASAGRRSAIEALSTLAAICAPRNRAIATTAPGG